MAGENWGPAARWARYGAVFEETGFSMRVGASGGVHGPAPPEEACFVQSERMGVSAASAGDNAKKRTRHNAAGIALNKA